MYRVRASGGGQAVLIASAMAARVCYHFPCMSDAGFTSDDVLGFEEELDPATGAPTGVLRVMLKDGSEREFRGEEIEQVRGILEHYTQPEA